MFVGNVISLHIVGGFVLGFVTGLLMSLLFSTLVPIMRTLWSFGVGMKGPLVYIFEPFF